MPYKQSVIKYLDKLNQSATITKAVNCIKRENNVYMGYNNDVVGFSKLLNKYNINIVTKNIDVRKPALPPTNIWE